MPNQNKIQKPQVIIPIGLSTVDCNNCRERNFQLKVLPQENTAKIVRIICSNCGKMFNIDNRGFIQGDQNLPKVPTSIKETN